MVSFTQFISENQRQLEQLYEYVLELNEELSFEDFCAFVYQHTY